jgi:hypothetical protein
MIAKVKCYDINWAVEPQDVADNLPEDATDEDFEKEIAFIKQDLPDEVKLTVEAENEDELAEIVSDELSEQTGWLHEGFKFDIIGKEESVEF